LHSARARLRRHRACGKAGGWVRLSEAPACPTALAQRIKHYPTPGTGRIWLGLTGSTSSLRDEPRLSDIWEMVARLRRYWALTLPVAAAFYTAMTIDSALQYRRGRGGRWKGRIAAPAAPRTQP
jgi:hypothetical protein